MKFHLLSLSIVFMASGVARADNPPSPVRQAKMQAIVTKTWNEKQSDGTYKLQTEQVCTVTASIPVYESSAPTPQAPNMQSGPTCKTQLKVGASTITIASEIVLLDGVQNPFNSGTAANWKAFVGAFWVVNDKGDYFKLGSVNSNLSEDQQQKSLIQYLNSNGLTANGNGDQVLDENLSVLLRYED